MSDHPSALSSEYLLEKLKRLPIPRMYWIGFSGGADSTALLQALYECRETLAAPIHALHFHHGLQAEAGDWQSHCKQFCEQRGIPFHSEQLNVSGGNGDSLEQAARNARYRAVARIIGPDELYLTAHHAEDQAETLFLNLMRGSGIEGLAGIPEIRNLEPGWVARPLLDIRRNELVAFLEERKIGWLEDPSNQDKRFDRNYLRLELFPLLERRWPGISQRLERTARNARATSSALSIFIETQSGDLLQDRLKMPVHKLLELSHEMQPLILRQWLRRHEVPMLPESRLREFLAQLASAQLDNMAEVQWEGWMIKHYRQDLWLHRRNPDLACPQLEWTSGAELDVGPDAGTLNLEGVATEIPPGWTVGPRTAGARIRTIEHGPSQKLKHFFQSSSIPPWVRKGIPVLYWDGEPVALGDWILGHRLQWWLTENNLEYIWRPLDPVLARIRSDCQR
jgi:tRNA(Ile)-lysidine synthase